MVRLTENISKKQSYCAYELKDCTYKNIYNLKSYSEIEEYADCDLTLGIDKLGELEDVMEKHNINDVNELNHALDVLEMFKKSIKVTRIDPPVAPIVPDENGNYVVPLTKYLVEVQQFKLESKLHKALTEWIMKNIDKETILKWLCHSHQRFRNL